MHKRSFFFSALLLPLDFFVVAGAGFAAWYLRFAPGVRRIWPVIFDLTFQEYAWLVVGAAVLSVIFLSTQGLYNPRLKISFAAAVFRIAVSQTMVLAAIALAIFLRQELFESRFLVFVAWGFSILFLSFARGIAIALRSLLLARGIGATKVLLVGSDPVSLRLAEHLSLRPHLGLRLVKHLHEPDIGEVAQAVGNPGVETIVLGAPDFARERILELIDFANENRLDFVFVPNIVQTLTASARAEVIGDVPVIELRRTVLEGWGMVVKRTIDLIITSLLLALALPVMAFVSLAIKLDSPGPIFYRDRRIGPKGEFWTLKFRSMFREYCTGAEYGGGAAESFEEKLISERNFRKGPVPKIENDPRRTRAGRWLEKTSLDELPQLFNVISGNMSLVGPRPHRPKEVALYEKRHKRVFAVPPGITGLAQISGRSDLGFEDEVLLDTYYMEHWSPWLDLVIMAKTPLVMFFRKHRS